MFALNVASWPPGLPLAMLSDVLMGAQDAAAEGEWLIAGGHTVSGAEPTFGQAVTGSVEAARLRVVGGCKVGQSLVLTKPLGTGIVATAIKGGLYEGDHADAWFSESVAAAVASMVRLNREAADVANAAEASACTDVTGFGLLGHLHDMLKASRLAAIVHPSLVERLPSVTRLAEAGSVPGGTKRNLDHVAPRLVAAGASPVDLAVLGDPQTSGGLLFSCDPVAADDAVLMLRASGHGACVVGAIIDGAPGEITLVD